MKTLINTLIFSLLAVVAVSQPRANYHQIATGNVEFPRNALFSGDIEYQNGSEANGYFLMSDENGVANWSGDVFYDNLDSSINIFQRKANVVSETSTFIGSGDPETGELQYAIFDNEVGVVIAAQSGQSIRFDQISDNDIGVFQIDFTENIVYIRSNTSIDGELTYTNGSEASGYVLTSDANGGANWALTQNSTLSETVTEATTTTTDWETLASYTMPANTLSGNGNSLSIIAAVSVTEATDSLKIEFGATTIWIDENKTIAESGLVRLTANSQLHYQGGTLATASEDLTSPVSIVVKAKSTTIGNQTLKYFKVVRQE